jgi:hypothetical protein
LLFQWLGDEASLSAISAAKCDSYFVVGLIFKAFHPQDGTTPDLCAAAAWG